MSTSSLVPCPAGAARPSLAAHARFVAGLLSDTATRFSRNEGYRLGAAFSFYATFSIFPLLLIAMTIVGFVLGDSAPARQRLLSATSTPGSPVYDVLDRTLTAMQQSQGARGLSAVIGLATLGFAASGAFVELDVALNRIWCVAPRHENGVLGSIRGFLVDRLTGFVIVLGLGLTLLVSLASSSILANVMSQMSQRFAMPLWAPIARALEEVLSMGLLWLVFILAFHLIPRTRPSVRVVFAGAALTTILLTALKELFASYLAHLTSYSAYGVAGGMLALASWIFLSSQIILFCAQLTRVHAERLGAT